MFEVACLAFTQGTDFPGFEPLLDTRLAKDTHLTGITELRVLKQTQLLTDNASEHIFD